MDGRLVGQADDNAHDDPLHKIGDGLLNGQLKADVQVDVVVYDKRADGEDADEGSEACAFNDA